MAYAPEILIEKPFRKSQLDALRQVLFRGFKYLKSKKQRDFICFPLFFLFKIKKRGTREGSPRYGLDLPKRTNLLSCGNQFLLVQPSQHVIRDGSVVGKLPCSVLGLAEDCKLPEVALVPIAELVLHSTESVAVGIEHSPLYIVENCEDTLLPCIFAV